MPLDKKGKLLFMEKIPQKKKNRLKLKKYFYYFFLIILFFFFSFFSSIFQGNFNKYFEYVLFRNFAGENRNGK